jgi:hypothetical protein
VPKDATNRVSRFKEDKMAQPAPTRAIMMCSFDEIHQPFPKTILQ